MRRGPTPLGRLIKIGYEAVLEREITNDEQELLMSKIAKKRLMFPIKEQLEEILIAGW